MNNTFMKQDRVDGHILQQPITYNYRRYVSSTSTKQIDCRQQYIFCEGYFDALCHNHPSLPSKCNARLHEKTTAILIAFTLYVLSYVR
uniref:Uncharacterized protein n=1 Tax=Oryza barthii TaxID=65489 RepID=A0A0D3GQP8_9ORYZ